MKPTVSHGWTEKTPEAKARWFQSLSVAERMEVFCAFADLALTIHPELAVKKDARPVEGRIRVLSRP